MTKNAYFWRPSLIQRFDHVVLWFDHSGLPIDISKLRRHCRDLEVILGQMDKNACWKLKLKVLQPSRQFFKVLLSALGLRIRVLINYVEIARDLLARDLSDRVIREFLASTVIPRLHTKTIIFCDDTAYGALRSVSNSKSGKFARNPNVPLLYAHRPSKLARDGYDPTREIHPASPPCFHLEWRCSGAPSVRAAGIGSMVDLIDFDHDRFWNQHMNLFALPDEKTELGRLLSRKPATDDGNLKRANRFLEKFSHDGNFIMHDAVRNTPGLAAKLQRRTFEEVVGSALADVPSYQGVRIDGLY